MLSIPSSFIRIIAFLIALTVIPVVNAPGQIKPQSQPKELPKDDPHAREAFDRNMLKDPATGTIPADIRDRELEFAKSIPSVESARLLKQSTGKGLQSQHWTSRGPKNIGGRTRAFAIDIANERVLLAGGVSGGVWKSVDAGASWVRVTPLSVLQSVSCIAQDTRPGHTETWYYGTGEVAGNSASAPEFSSTYRGNGIFKSTDNGSTWKQLASISTETPEYFGPFSYIFRIAADPGRSDSDIVYASTVSGLFRSNDGGDTWRRTLGEADSYNGSADIAVSSQGVVYATMSTHSLDPEGNFQVTPYPGCGIFRSTDGITWTNITPANYPELYPRVVLAIAPSNESIVYFLANTPNEGFCGKHFETHSIHKYTYKSGDGAGAGGEWEDRSRNVPLDVELVSYFGYCLTIAVKPDNPDFIVIGGTNLFVTQTGFGSHGQCNWIGGYNRNSIGWLDQMYPNHHPDIHETVFSRSNPTVMYTASDGGVHRTDDCAANKVVWNSLNNGFLTSQFYAVAIHPTKSGDRTVMGGMQDNGTYGSLRPGEDWKWLGGGDGGFCVIPAVGNDHVFTMCQYGDLYRINIDPNLTATHYVASGTEDPNVGFPWMTHLELDPNDDNIGFICAFDQVYRNTDIHDKSSSFKWESMTESNPQHRMLSAIEACNGANRRLYIASSDAWLGYLDDAYNSNDEPTNITGVNFPEGGYIGCIAADPENTDRVMAVFTNYGIPSLFYSENGGTTWTDVSGNLEAHPDGSGAGPSCRWAEILHNGGGTLWLVGTSTGLYSTTRLNGSQTEWVQEGSGVIGNAVVSMVRSRQSDGFVAAATHGNGVFTTAVEPVSVSPAAVSPEAWYLERCAPNPAVSTASVRYSVSSGEAFALKIYDTLGKEKSVLAEGSVSPGIYTAEFSVQGLLPGMYFIRLHSGSFSQTRTLIVQ